MKKEMRKAKHNWIDVWIILKLFDLSFSTDRIITWILLLLYIRIITLHTLCIYYVFIMYFFYMQNHNDISSSRKLY